jgi:hypothetical protein
MRKISSAIVQRCIYCGADGRALTREHIIPFGLCGDLVLPNASCTQCSKVTGQIELKVLRGFTQQARIALGLKTRNPDKAPKNFVLGVVKNGVESKIQVPANEHCVVLPLPLFDPPSFLASPALNTTEKNEEGIKLKGIVTLWLSDREKTRQRYGADEIVLETEIDQISFARMLGKIGYCQAVSEFGLDAIKEAYVLPAILGKRNDIGRWVGSTEPIPPPQIGVGHQIFATTVKRSAEKDSDDTIVAGIRLFAHLQSPIYTVVVGSKR